MNKTWFRHNFVGTTWCPIEFMFCWSYCRLYWYTRQYFMTIHSALEVLINQVSISSRSLVVCGCRCVENISQIHTYPHSFSIQNLFVCKYEFVRYFTWQHINQLALVMLLDIGSRKYSNSSNLSLWNDRVLYWMLFLLTSKFVWIMLQIGLSIMFPEDVLFLKEHWFSYRMCNICWNG